MNVQRIYALVQMEIKKIIREPAYLFMMLLLPLVLTLSFGLGMGSVPSSVPGKSQFEFMVPGLFSYACIFIIMIVAQVFSEDREQGLLKRINVTPTTSGEFMGSNLITNTLLSAVQVAIVAICAFLIGFRAQGGAAGLALAFLFVMILSVCSVGLGLITATIAKTSGAATGISFVFILPQMFFGTFIPITETTRPIAMFLPSYYVTDAITMIFNGVALTEVNIWFDLIVVLIISVVIVIIGILLFKRYGKA